MFVNTVKIKQKQQKKAIASVASKNFGGNYVKFGQNRGNVIFSSSTLKPKGGGARCPPPLPWLRPCTRYEMSKQSGYKERPLSSKNLLSNVSVFPESFQQRNELVILNKRSINKVGQLVYKVGDTFEGFRKR